MEGAFPERTILRVCPMRHYVHDVNGDHALQYCKSTWLAFASEPISTLDSVKVICRDLDIISLYNYFKGDVGLVPRTSRIAKDGRKRIQTTKTDPSKRVLTTVLMKMFSF